MSIQPTLKSEWVSIILDSLEELASRPDPGLDLWDYYYRRVKNQFGIPSEESTTSINNHIDISKPARGIQEELLQFFLSIKKEIQAVSPESSGEINQHLLLLHKTMGAELELPAKILLEKLKDSHTRAQDSSLEEDCVHLINRLCHRDWKNELKKFHLGVLSEQVAEEASEKNFEPEISTISSHLFAGALAGALVLGLHNSLGIFSQWLTIPFLISGLAITYFWVVRETKFMMAFLTSLGCGLSAFTLFGSHSTLGPTLIKVLEITSGTILGGLIGLYYGYTRWYKIKESLHSQFSEQRLKHLTTETLPNLFTLHRFCSESVLPHFQHAKTAVASLLNEAYTSKDECEKNLNQLKDQAQKPNFEEFFEIHKSRNEHEIRIRELENLYNAFHKLETHLQERVIILKNAADSERFQILSGAPGNMDHLFLGDKDFSGANWKRKLSRQRIFLVLNWMRNFRPFLEFELERKLIQDPDQWINRLPDQLNRVVA